MKIGVITVAFNEERFIKACIAQFRGGVEEHLVLVSEKPWRGGWNLRDKTPILAAEAGATVIHGDWPNQAEQFNYGLERLKGLDWVIICDADEFYTPKDVLELLEQLTRSTADAFSAPNMEVYWRTREWRVRPIQTDNPIVAVRSHVRFSDKRSCDAGNIDPFSGVLHHFSYVRDNEEMRKKISSFEHSNEFDLAGWYDNVWLTATPESTNLHPVVPSQFAHLIHAPAPPLVGPSA